MKIRPEKKNSGLYGIPYRPEGINWTKNKALTKINLNCFYRFFVFFVLKFSLVKCLLMGEKKEKESCCVLQWQEAVLHEMMDCCLCCQT